MRKIKNLTCCNGSININFYDGTSGRLFIKSCCDNCTKTASFIDKEDELHFENGNVNFFVLTQYQIPPMRALGAKSGYFQNSWSQWVSIEFYHLWCDERIYLGAAMIGMTMYKNQDDSFCGNGDIIDAISHEGLEDLYGLIKAQTFGVEIKQI